MAKTVTFTYLNHRGSKEERTVDVEKLDYQNSPGFGYQAGWFVSGFCHKKQAYRSFALDRIILSEDSPPRHFTLINLKDA